MPLSTHTTQRTRGRKPKSGHLDESTQVVETFVTQTQLGREPLASKVLNFEFKSIPKKRGRKPKSSQLVDNMNKADKSSSSQIVQNSQYGIVTRNRVPTMSQKP
jgi:hypothetical protein